MGNVDRSDHFGRRFHRLLGRFFGRFGLHMFRTGHLVITEVIFFHNFYTKLMTRMADIPEGTPNYGWKVFAPPLMFGTKHAILFQLAVIPLTMARHLLTLLSGSPTVNRIIPFPHMTEFHMHLGYTFCALTAFALVGFLIYYSKICADYNAGRDPDNMCKGLTSEIMVTGYSVTLATLVMFLTSHFRHKMRFETFYIFHHMFLAAYALSLAHTLDGEYRNGRQRSQCYVWFSASLSIYVADRIWTFCAAHRNVKVESLAVAEDSSVLSLSLKKPVSFKFKPGQHAFLQIPAIDWTWHPFSVASEPASHELRFLIEVKEPGSWTDQLAGLSLYVQGLRVNLMGGFGSMVSDLKSNTEVLAVGTGTGIVPMISLMLERKRRLLMLNKGVWLDANEVKDAQYKYTSSLEHPVLRYLQLKWRCRQVQKLGQNSIYLRNIRRKARWELVHAVVDVVACSLILVELWLCCTTISWASLPDETSADSTMGRILKYVGTCAISLYSFHSIYRWVQPRRFTRSFRNVFEFFAICGMIVTLVVWWDLPYDMKYGTEVVRVAVRVGFCLWRMAWLWLTSPVVRQNEAQSGNLGKDLLLESTFRLIWSCRSADLMMGMLPEFDRMLQELRSGLRTSTSGLRTFIDIELYCTESDIRKLRHLMQHVQGTALEGAVHYGRPDLQSAIFQVMRRQLADGLNGGPSKLNGAQSLVTFCGAPEVGRRCMQFVEEANLMADTLALYQHKVNFREEFFGIVAGARAKRQHRPAPMAATDRADSVYSI